jgi:uncharacterized protein YprB with RNaseH-like and TPR domain
VNERKDLRKSLDQLNRGPLPRQDGPADVDEIRRRMRRLREATPPPQPAIIYRRDLPHVAAPSRHAAPAGPSVRLEEAVPGREVATPAGSVYLVETRLSERPEDWSGVCDAFPRELSSAGSAVRRVIRSSCGLDALDPGDLVFLDLETTGLAGTPLFLVGTMAWEEGLVVRQFFARNYAQEAGVISCFLQAASRRRLLVTFNGKSFDVPYVRVRAAATRVPFGLDLAHLDLLHECRRVWGGALPDCRLQTLESRVCGRPRHGDIPGQEIPAAYHDFVRTGDAGRIARVLEHNVLDLATLAELLVRLPKADVR